MASRRTNGVAIRELRTALGISQTELAAAVGVNKSAICRLEGGKQPKTFETTRRIANRLGVRLDAITYPVAEPELFKPDEVCEVLGITLDEFEELATSGQIAVTRIGSGPKALLRVSEKALEDYIARHLPEPVAS
jgi:excisionase family DNA binding protein